MRQVALGWPAVGVWRAGGAGFGPGAQLARLAQPAHGAPHDDGMRDHTRGERLRRHGAVMVGHVQQTVQDGEEAGVVVRVVLTVP